MAFWDKFLEEEGEKEASELQATTKTNIPIEAISEQNEILLVENTGKEKKAQISDFVGYELDELSMDEVRAQYIFTCKEKPKHDSIQTKNFLINKIIKTLEQSKTKS